MGYNLSGNVPSKPKLGTRGSNVRIERLPDSLTSSTRDLIDELPKPDPLRQIQKSVVVRQQVSRAGDVNDMMALDEHKVWEMRAGRPKE